MASPRIHSADVHLELWVGESRRSLAQMGSDTVVLRAPWFAPPGDATIVMHTDGRRHVWSVSLPDGIQPDSRLVRVSNRRYQPRGTSHVTSV